MAIATLGAAPRRRRRDGPIATGAGRDARSRRGIAKLMSRLETQHLLALARDKSVAARQALTATVTDLFFARGNVLTDRERSLMTEILRQLINDVESSVRRVLAEKLAHQEGAPRDLILALANDEIVVAQSILMHSEVLRDEELIEIIHHRTLEHQLAVAMRKSVNEPVTDALVETGNVD